MASGTKHLLESMLAWDARTVSCNGSVARMASGQRYTTVLLAVGMGGSCDD